MNNGENITKKEIKEFDIQNIKELKNKLEDFKKQNPDFDVQRLKADIVKKLDNKEDVSDTEKKLLNLLDKAGSIDNAILIIDSIITQLESTILNIILEKGTKIVKKIKNQKDKIKQKYNKLKVKVKETTRKIINKTKELDKSIMLKEHKQSQIIEIKKEIDKISSQDLSKEKKEEIINNKKLELERIKKILDYKENKDKELELSMEKDKIEIEETKKVLQSLNIDKKDLEELTEKSTKELGEVINKATVIGDNKKIKKATDLIIQTSHIVTDIKEVDTKEMTEKTENTKKEMELHEEIIIDIHKENKEVKKDLSEAEKKLNKYSNMLSFGRNFNEFDNSYYIKNTKEIKNITDIKKLGEILGQIKNCKMSYDELVNIELKGDINVLKLVYEKIYKPKNKKFGIQDTKDFNFSSIESKEEFLSMLKDHAIKKYLITEESERKEQKSINEYLENFKDIKLKEKIEEIFKTINNTKFNNIEKIDEKIFNLDRNEIDNYLTINGFDKHGNILENIINLFVGKNIKKLGNYPKLLDKIMSNNNKNIYKIIENIPSFYYIFLPESEKSNYSEIYFKGLIKNNTNINYKELSKIRFNNIEQIVSLFKIINNKGINLDILIKYPEIKSTLFSFLNNKDNQNSLSNIKNEETKQIINSIQNIIGNNYKQINDYKEKYEESEFNKQLKENRKKLSEKLYGKDKEKSKFLKYVLNLENDIQGPIVGLTEITLGIDTNEKQYNYYISQLANGEKMTPKIFEDTLKKINLFVKETYLANKEEEENTKLSKIDSGILEKASKNFVKNKEFINYEGIENSFTKFIEIKELEAKKKKIDFNSSDYINEFIKIYGLNGLSEKWKVNILQNLKNKEKVEKFSILVKQTEKKPEKVFNAFKNLDKKEIEEIWKKVDIEYKKQTKINLVNYEKIHGKIELPIKINVEIQNDLPIINDLYKIEQFPTEITENNILVVNGKTINNISSGEYKQLNIKEGKVGNPEALKNLINMKEKLDKLGLGFIWENKKTIFKIMKNNSEFKGSKINETDHNLVDKREFNLLLQFILKIYGDKNTSSVESNNVARILKINEIGAISEKKDFHTGLSDIGQKFVEIGFFNSSGEIKIFGEEKLRNYVKNGYKNKQEK